MSYTPKIPKDAVIASENSFLFFSSMSFILYLLLILSFYYSKLDDFWIGNRIWASGSAIVFLSVVQIRFFNIKSNASPDNRNFNLTDFRGWILNLEKIYSYIWIIGFILIGISRWNQW
ncbi:hypothetical protein [Sulfurimonas sp.]|uniref:hypothetical protein n=1 Tax=Sulfurimonas sp. TaxID=2022749 RepID=UPI002AB03F87|nr:hypothetical protein [Sulfurimonas sp.]